MAPEKEASVLEKKWASKEQQSDKSFWWVTSWEENISSNLLPMYFISEVSNWLISSNILWVNTWSNIDPTVQVLSTCGHIFVASWYNRGQSNKTAILWGRGRQYGELTLFTYVYFTGYVKTSIRVTRSVPESIHRFITRFGSNQCLH